MTTNDFFTIVSLAVCLPQIIVYAQCYGELKRNREKRSGEQGNRKAGAREQGSEKNGAASKRVQGACGVIVNPKDLPAESRQQRSYGAFFPRRLTVESILLMFWAHGEVRRWNPGFVAENSFEIIVRQSCEITCK